MEVALQDDAVFVDQFYYPRDRALDQARELGVTRLRVNLMWKDALAPEQFNARRRPSRPRYDFRPYDAPAHAAAAPPLRASLRWRGALAPEQFNARRRPSRPRYDFRRYDDLVDAAAARGIR